MVWDLATAASRDAGSTAAVAVAGGGSPLERAAPRGSLGNELPGGRGLGCGGATRMAAGARRDAAAGLGSGGRREARGWAASCSGSKACRWPGAVWLSLRGHLRAHCHLCATTSSADPRSHQTLLPSGEVMAPITSHTPGLSVCPQTLPLLLASNLSPIPGRGDTLALLATGLGAVPQSCWVVGVSGGVLPPPPHLLWLPAAKHWDAGCCGGGGN